jgi:GrpB-like predicted nucleotidyltransferase (UPF0157 family)
LMPNHAAPNWAVLVPYDSSWGPHGIALAQQLRITLAPMALRVEHIGSTAIPGMAAKPVFDLQVSVEYLDRAAHAFERPLADHGFHRLPYEQDHVPAGYNDDPARWAKRIWAGAVAFAVTVAEQRDCRHESLSPAPRFPPEVRLRRLPAPT